MAGKAKNNDANIANRNFIFLVGRIHYTYPNACCGAFKPNILTVCNGVGQGSSLNIQRGLVPNLQDNDGPVAEWHLWLGRLKSLRAEYRNRTDDI
ncbi:hypothetical protein [Cyanophage S-TIM5]|uniref:Uncharacterized protein n=1 Tax=Cyanophage S-TIM5 TaxID=1137745 RepID=H6WG89_9CAUD|nr:hypothetical protein F417_gp179 [Cyanophage S-TIM5]AEZ65634.1 hypothetical protein [Cyanophage S-TIM5]UYE96801.1 hypothetical protein [Cyanophage S-TIM66]UYE97014.1 hypothetical protein [Cyanophage S-TIM61]